MFDGFTLEPLPQADLIAFFESINVVLPETYYANLYNGAAQHAFTMARFAQATQIQTVLDHLAAHVSTGGHFGDWLDNLPPLGLEKSYLELIYRNALGNAYSFGKASRTMRNKNDRPYILYDAINDSVTRPTHRALDGIVLPVEHPLWRTHLPLNGHRCRCNYHALTEAEARAAGITLDYEDHIKRQASELDIDVNDVKPDPGWDTSFFEDKGPDVKRWLDNFRSNHKKVLDRLKREVKEGAA